MNLRPSGYEPCSGYSEKRRILANTMYLNNVQHVQFVPHVQRLGTIYDLRLGTQGKTLPMRVTHDGENDAGPLPSSQNPGVSVRAQFPSPFPFIGAQRRAPNALVKVPLHPSFCRHRFRARIGARRSAIAGWAAAYRPALEVARPYWRRP